MRPQDPKDVTRNTARNLSALAGELAALKGDATNRFTDPEYAALRLRLEAAHAATEAALVEARRRVWLNEGQERLGGCSGCNWELGGSMAEIRKLRPGDEVYVRMAFQNVVSLKNALVFFLHE